MAARAPAVQGTFAMVDDKPEDPSPDPERGRRPPPTLDLDAVEISDETSNGARADAGEHPERVRSAPGLLATVASAGIVSPICGAAAAAFVVWPLGWPGKTAPPAPASAPQVSPAAL